MLPRMRTLSKKREQVIRARRVGRISSLDGTLERSRAADHILSSRKDQRQEGTLATMVACRAYFWNGVGGVGDRRRDSGE